MSQLSRLISILTLLRSKRLLTSSELSEKFGVSIRTIYRDIRKLEEAGVPISTVEGRGYSLLDGYTVAPVMFDQEEANALVTAEKLIGKTNDKSLIKQFNSALTKVKSIFKSSLQSKSEFLNEKMAILEEPKDLKSNSYSNSLADIQVAITNFLLVEIEYVKAGAMTSTIRTIEPAALYCMLNNWVVIAWCHLRDDYRAFRLDRIEKYTVSVQHFEDRKFDLRAYFIDCANFEIS